MKTTALAVTTALLSFVIGTVWVFADARMFVQYFYAARMVALTHVFTLGWVSLMIIGVLRQLGPVAFGLQLRQPSWIGGAVAVWIPALIVMVFGFATSRYTLAAIGTSILLMAVLLIVFIFASGFRWRRQETPHKHLLASLLYFGGAAVLGTWMALAKGFDVPLPAPFHRVLFAHLHLAGGGWVGMAIIAVMSRLFPQPHLRHPLHARIRFTAFNLGLTGLAAGLLIGGYWYTFSAVILAVACIWYACAFIPVLSEFEQASDRSTKFLITAWFCLALTGGIGLWLCTGIGEVTAFRIQLQFVYGFLYLFGWVSLMIFGMLYRMLPTHISKFLTSRGIDSGKRIRTAFVHPYLQTAAWILLVCGLLVSAFGILWQKVGLFQLGWTLWLAGIASLVAGLVRAGMATFRVMRSPRVA